MDVTEDLARRSVRQRPVLHGVARRIVERSCIEELADGIARGHRLRRTLDLVGRAAAAPVVHAAPAPVVHGMCGPSRGARFPSGRRPAVPRRPHARPSAPCFAAVPRAPTRAMQAVPLIALLASGVPTPRAP